MKQFLSILAMMALGSPAAFAVDGNPFLGFKKEVKLDIAHQKSSELQGAASPVAERTFMDLSRARRIGNINGREVWFDEGTHSYINPSEADVNHAPRMAVNDAEVGSIPAPPHFNADELPQLPLPLNRPGATSPSSTAVKATNPIKQAGATPSK